jgi:hypothetical protein
MRTVFQLLLLVTFVVFSPLIFIVLAFRASSVSTDMLKTQLVKKDVYTSAVAELHKHIDLLSEEGERDDPLVIAGPFIKKEISPAYIKGKVETFIDDTQAWIKGKSGEPVLSFKDVRDKLVTQNKNIVNQLENMLKEMEAQQKNMEDQYASQDQEAGSEKMPFTSRDFETFLTSDFTLPMGVYIGWLKTTVAVMHILGIVLAICYGLSLLLIILLASSLQSKLRWVGWTFLLTAVWNIPGIFLSAGSSVMLTKMVTQSIDGAQYITPFVETLMTPVIASYARMTSGVTVALFIFSIGILIVSSLAKPAQVTIVSPKSSNKTKK